jgi:diketogulonate reductase-like aldo/keto reductase
MLYIHSPFVEIPMKDYMWGLNEAQDLGLTKSIAVSNFNIDELKKAIELSQHPIVANQIRYNVLYKTDATVEPLEFCKKNSIMIVAYQPVERTLLGKNTSNKVVLEIAEKYQKTPAQIALNWLIRQDNVVAIPKASSQKHIDENLLAMDFELEEEDVEKLDSIVSMDP